MQQKCDAEHERALINRALDDPAAFQCLYNKYFPKVYAFVGYHAGRNQEIEDLVAEIFLKIVERLKQFEWRGQGSFAAWVFRIARNCVHDYYRQTQKKQFAIPLEELPELEANELLPLDSMMQKEKFAYLRDLIDTLSPRQKEILTLKFFGALRNQEIAELLDLDERTVAAYLCRGIKALHGKYLNVFRVTGAGPHE